MSKFTLRLKRNGEIDPFESVDTEVKSFAEATFYLVENLVATAGKDWSVEITEEWLRQASQSPWPWTSLKDPGVFVTKMDNECEWTFAYEV